MNLRFASALLILINCSVIPVLVAQKCNSTTTSTSQIISQFSECVHRSSQKTDAITHDLSQELIRISRRCFASSTEMAHRYGFCPISEFTVDLPGFAWLSWGPLAAFSPATELADVVLQAFLTEPMCFMRSIWPAVWTEFATAKRLNASSKPVELPHILEAYLAEPQNWANWFNALSIRVMHAIALKNCRKHKDFGSEFADATQECLDALQEEYDKHHDDALALHNCQDKLGSDCGAVFEKIEDAFCEFVEDFGNKAKSGLDKLVADYEGMKSTISFLLKYIPKDIIVESCFSRVRNAFITETQDWFTLMNETRDKCLPNDWSLEHFVHYICVLLGDNTSKIKPDMIYTLQTIAETTIYHVTRGLAGPNNYCEQRKNFS